MMDQFRGQVADEVLRVVLTHFYRMGFGAGYGYEDWSTISPDLSMSRKHFQSIKEDVSGIVDQDLSEAVDKERFFEQITPKLQAISSQSECEKIVQKLKELLDRKPGSGKQMRAKDVGQMNPDQVPEVLQKAPQQPASPEEVQEQYDSRKEASQASAEGSAEFDLNLFFENDDQSRALAGKLIQENRQDMLPRLFELQKKAPLPILKACILRLLPGSEYQEEVYNFLNDEDPRVLATAIEALEAIGDEKSYSLISTFTNHVHNRVRANSIKAMHKLSPDKAKGVLSKMMSSKYSAYRDSAMFVMCTLADPRFLDLMEASLNDPEATVRDKALQGLQYLALQGEERAKVLVEERMGNEPDLLSGN